MSEQGTATIIANQKIRSPSIPIQSKEWAVYHRGVWFIFSPVNPDQDREEWHLSVDFAPGATTKITPGDHSGRPIVIKMGFQTLMERFEAWFSNTDQPDFANFSVAINHASKFAKLMLDDFKPRGSKL